MSHVNFIIDLARCRFSGAQWWSIVERNPKAWGSIPGGDTDFFLRPTLFFIYFFAELKTYHPSFYLHTK